MTGRGRGLLGAGVVTLLLAAWVSATGPVAIFARADLTNFEAKAPGQDFGTAVSDPSEGRRSSDVLPGDAHPLLASIVTWTAKVLLALVVLALLVAAARAVRTWWRTRAEPVVEATDDLLVPEVLLRGAREGEVQLGRGTPANAVVAAWVALESAVRAVGVRDDATRTSAELVTVVLRSHSVDRAPLDTLAALYREARFSTHPIDEARRDQAREALQQVQVELRRAAAGAGLTSRRPATPAPPAARRTR
ncbi:MAG: DUF4129 domain-containing protein [Pedococcus sp.]